MQPTSQYTITLDDDSSVHKLIARITKIHSIPFVLPEKLLDRASSYKPVCVFIDVNLGVDTNGIDFVQKLRAKWPFAPIFVITGSPKSGLIGRALALGANDFIQKPLDPEEVMARLEARLSEMASRMAREQMVVGDLIYIPRDGSVMKDEQTVHLPPLESRLFHYLSQRLGIKSTKSAIRTHLWHGIKTCENALDKKISNLRKILHDLETGLFIETNYGGGVTMRFIEKSKENAS